MFWFIWYVDKFFKKEQQQEHTQELIRDHHSYQTKTKKELEEVLLSSDQQHQTSKKQHQNVKQEIKEINVRLSELRYQKVGLLHRQKHALKKADTHWIDNTHELQEIELKLNEVMREQEALNICRDNLNKQRTDLWHKTIPQTKKDLALAFEALKDKVYYISEEEARNTTRSLQSLTSPWASYEEHISLKQLQTVNKLLWYDNTFTYCETSLQPWAPDYLYVMIDSSKTNTPWSLIKYVWENHHEFKVLAKIPVSSITSHYWSDSIQDFKEPILDFYTLYNSPNNQFFIQEYAKAFNTNPHFSFRRVINKALSRPKLEQFIETGSIGTQEVLNQKNMVFLDKYHASSKAKLN